MRQLICDMGGYEVLMHGSRDDASRQIWAKVGEHPPVTIHNEKIQAMLDRLYEFHRLGILWWGPRVGFEEWNRWVMSHDVRTGKSRPEKERMIAEAVREVMKELSE